MSFKLKYFLNTFVQTKKSTKVKLQLSQTLF